MTRLVLASASATRAAMLRAAGLAFEQIAPGVDEEAVKESLKAAGAPAADLAAALAEIKAAKVSAGRAGALVIGADQVLECEGRLFDKPVDWAGARAQLLALRGRDHRLFSAVCLAEGGGRVWHHVAAARLRVRPFGEAFLEDYLERAGEAVTRSVGAYQAEGLGAQLFESIEGDHFTILGLPLLPLLAALRERGELAR